MPSTSWGLLIAPEGIFQPATPMRRSSSSASMEKGELRNSSPRSSLWLFRAAPLLGVEFHAVPVIEARFVLQAEAFPPRLGQGALGCSDVGLELDGIRAPASTAESMKACAIPRLPSWAWATSAMMVQGACVTWIVQPGIGQLDIGSIMGGEPARHSIPALGECLEQRTISGDNADLMIQPAGAGCPVAAAEQGPVLVAVLDQHKLVVHG